eukprot:854689-Pelagomonas_calceolata.AAC.3
MHTPAGIPHHALHEVCHVKRLQEPHCADGPGVPLTGGCFAAFLQVALEHPPLHCHATVLKHGRPCVGLGEAGAHIFACSQGRGEGGDGQRIDHAWKMDG